MDYEWGIRKASGSDLSFIYSTWLNSYKGDSLLGKTVSRSIFFKEYAKVIDGILQRDAVDIQVACKKDEPNVVFGYLVGEPLILHYAFVKKRFCGLGILKSLSLNFVLHSYTHKTKTIEPILKKQPNLFYNPFLIYEKGEPIDGREEKAGPTAVS